MVRWTTLIVEDIPELDIVRYNGQGTEAICHCVSGQHSDENPSMSVNVSDKYGAAHCWSCDFSANIFTHFGYTGDSGGADGKIIAALVSRLINKVEIPHDAEAFIKDFRNISAETYEDHSAFTSLTLDTYYKVEGEIRERVWFPITDIEGDITYLHGRLIEDHASKTVMARKYHNTPAGARKVMYPYDVMPKKRRVYLVEGFFDYLNLYDKGVMNVICLFGLGGGIDFSHLNCKYITLLLDGDTSGKAKAEKLRETLSSRYIVDIITLPKKIDPGNMTDKMIEEYIK